MSHAIHIPRLGWSMDEGTFVRWLKQPGESVEIGEPLFELESEKAIQAVEAMDAGILYIPPDSPAPGDVVSVGTRLGYLLAQGEAIPGTAAIPVAHQASESPQPVPAALPAKAEMRNRTIASPRARRVARELGVDWNRLQGTGREGRIREADVRAESTRRRLDANELSSGGAALSSRRRTIAERLRRSQAQTVPVTLTTTLDATNLVALREHFKTRGAAIVPAYTDIVAYVVARELARHPHIAACWQGHQLSTPQQSSNGFDIGIAVHTALGLLVPVLRAVGSGPLLEVATQSRTLIEQARQGKLTAAQMQGGVFTISTLGAYGIEAFTPVINYPQVAILGLGAIRREAVVLPDGQIAARERMTLSLTFDHAALDGVPAAEFLRDVAAALMSPVVEHSS
jgi:pyruvate dehydrogenase E2 component (dihydrolipoamide acetyltransferase)